MKEINLTHGKTAIVDDADYERLSKYNWCVYKHRNTFYAARRAMVGGRSSHLKMHREILGLSTGDGQLVDHKNRNGIDNRRENLRIVTPSLNSYNRKKAINNTSGYRGVSWNKGVCKWVSIFTKDKKHKHIGCFKNAVEAAKEYDIAVLKYRGEDAILNFPDNIDKYADIILERI